MLVTCGPATANEVVRSSFQALHLQMILSAAPRLLCTGQSRLEMQYLAGSYSSYPAEGPPARSGTQ